MLTLGFTNVYYTLWQVEDPFKRYLTSEEWVMEQACSYQQNLSMEYEKAVEKIAAMSNGNYAVDLELRGNHSFTRELSKGDDFEVFQFTFGKLRGSDIRTCDDVWQINRAMTSEKKIRTRAIAKRRLIELGEIVRHTWVEEATVFNGGNDNENFLKPTIKRLYATKSQMDKLNGPVSAHYYNDGEKVELELKEISHFGYETQYGWTSICIYATPDNRMFKYKGSTPPEVSKEGFCKVKATVKHDEYQGVAETKLQRVKVLQAA